jgi:hypothetical protein
MLAYFVFFLFARISTLRAFWALLTMPRTTPLLSFASYRAAFKPPSSHYISTSMLGRRQTPFVSFAKPKKVAPYYSLQPAAANFSPAQTISRL